MPWEVPMATARLSPPVACPHEGQGVFRIGVDDGVAAIFGLAVSLADGSQLTLDRQADRVRGVDDLPGERNVVLEGQHRAVDHHRGEADPDRGEDLLVARAM